MRSFVFLIAFVISGSSALATDTVDCEGEKYSFRIYIGNERELNGMTVYEKNIGSEQFIPKEKFSIGHVWPDENTVVLKYVLREHGMPLIGIIATDEQSKLVIEDVVQYPVKCEWSTEKKGQAPFNNRVKPQP